MITKICLQCKKMFNTPLPQKKLCSAKCIKLWTHNYYLTNRERIIERNRAHDRAESEFRKKEKARLLQKENFEKLLKEVCECGNKQTEGIY